MANASLPMLRPESNQRRDTAAPTPRSWLSGIQRSSGVLGSAAGVITPETGNSAEIASPARSRRLL
jgi:hypothetical protein